MRRTLKKIWAVILLIFAHSGPSADKAVKEGLCDFSGQGKDRFGR